MRVTLVERTPFVGGKVETVSKAISVKSERSRGQTMSFMPCAEILSPSELI